KESSYHRVPRRSSQTEAPLWQIYYTDEDKYVRRIRLIQSLFQFWCKNLKLMFISYLPNSRCPRVSSYYSPSSVRIAGITRGLLHYPRRQVIEVILNSSSFTLSFI